MKRLPLLLLLTATLAPADVIHLRHGRQLRGEVVRETKDAIVLRTPSGEIRLQRSAVERIEPESDVELYLGQARDAVRDQDYGTARQRFELALGALPAEDPRREAVQKELEASERQSAPFLRRGTRTWSGPDPFQREEPEARIRELMVGAQVRADLRQQLVQLLYARARASFEERDFLSAAIDFGRAADAAEGNDQQTLRTYAYQSRLRVAAAAIRAGDAALAALAVSPLVEAELEGALAIQSAYLLGRAEELRQNRGAARRAYLLALQDLEVAHAELPVLRELARLRSAGSPVDQTTAGVSAHWKFISSAHFGIVHELEDGAGTLERTLEAAFRDVVRRLGLRNPSGEQIAVFLFKDREGYLESSGARGWSRAHATRLEGQDELVLTIYAYPGEGFEDTLRHEIAHILTWRELGDAVFPVWAGEGIAQFAEGDTQRERNRSMVQALAAQGQLPAWDGALRQMLYPIQETQLAIQAFYAQGGVMFELLAERIGPQRAIKALTRFNEEDPATVLRQVGIDLQGFLAELAERSGPR